MILALEAEKSPTINAIEDRFILPFLHIRQFCHTKNTLSIVESVKELMLHLFPTID